MEIKDAIIKAKNNDQKAFTFLLDTYWEYVYGFQFKRLKNENDAEDITIKTFSKAFDRIETFNEHHTFKTWLITISKNLHIDLLRKEKSALIKQKSLRSGEEAYHILDDAPTIEDQLITEQNLAKLLRDIKRLKPHYQEVIQLRYFQEYSYKQMAKELNEPINNIKVKLLRAKKLLATIIKG